jgi:competence ComEA-like helix-hairpin-helix protein
MALFNRRDRIAIAVIAVLILAGWGARLLVRTDSPDDIRVIRGALSLPAPAAQGDSALGKPALPAAEFRIDINRAGTAELERLPLIGPMKAAEIVKYRSEHGPFARLSDLEKVKGIGLKTFSRIEPFLTISGGKEGK